MRLLSVAKKLFYLRKREVTTIIYFNLIQPNKKSSKKCFPSFHSSHFVTNHGNGPLNAVKCFYGLFLTRFVILLAIFRCVVATIVVVFLFIVFYCFLYKLLCLFFSNIGAAILNPLLGKKMCL